MAPHSADSTIVHEISALGQLTGLKKEKKNVILGYGGQWTDMQYNLTNGRGQTLQFISNSENKICQICFEKKKDQQFLFHRRIRWFIWP